MPSGADTTQYTARFLLPDLMVQGQDNALNCPLWQDGALAAPTSGTVSVYDPSGTAVVDEAAVTVTDSIANYTWNPSASLTLGMGWRVEWTLLVSGETLVFRNSGALVGHSLYPVVTDADLFRRVPGLDPNGAAPISSESNFQDYLDEAWAMIGHRLIAQGNRPNLIMSPSALREVHLLLTLALIFEAFETRLNETWGEKANTYRERYEAAWARLRFEYDSDDSGEADGAAKRAAQPTIWLCGRG